MSVRISDKFTCTGQDLKRPQLRRVLTIAQGDVLAPVISNDVGELAG